MGYKTFLLLLVDLYSIEIWREISPIDMAKTQKAPSLFVRNRAFDDQTIIPSVVITAVHKHIR